MDSGFAAARAKVWEASDFVATTVARYPETFTALLASGDLERPALPGQLDRGLAEALAGLVPQRADDADLKRRLRLFRRREMLRIIWRDLGGFASLDETLEDLSELADVCIRQALDWTQAWTRTELGIPRATPGAGLGSGQEPLGSTGQDAAQGALAGRHARDERQGAPLSLLVIGMGKLGAREKKQKN
jgi:glutamate-ammonia-ligase adenylyltransferase